jgi:hypothetical protein
MITRIDFGRKVRCHNAGVEKLAPVICPEIGAGRFGGERYRR